MNKKLSYAAAGVALVIAGGFAVRTFVNAEGGRAYDEKRVTRDQVNGWLKELSNWGRWGKDDQIGTLNLITPDVRKKALGLVHEGIAVSLAHTLDRVKAEDNPRPQQLVMTQDNEGHAMDEYTIWYHGSTVTHIDALCHYSADTLYNGFPVSAISPEGCSKLGIENFKMGIMTRGILVDIPLMKGVPYLDAETPVYPSDVEAWEKFANIKIGSGDAVFLRTGRWALRNQKGAWDVAQHAAGWHASMMPWFKQRDVALIGNDGVQDVMPSGILPKAALVYDRPVHKLGIVAIGMPIMDVMDLEAVSAEAARLKRWEFLLTAAPMPFLHGTGFPINPIATF